MTRRKTYIFSPDHHLLFGLQLIQRLSLKIGFRLKTDPIFHRIWTSFRFIDLLTFGCNQLSQIGDSWSLIVASGVDSSAILPQLIKSESGVHCLRLCLVSSDCHSIQALVCLPFMHSKHKTTLQPKRHHLNDGRVGKEVLKDKH